MPACHMAEMYGCGYLLRAGLSCGLAGVVHEPTPQLNSLLPQRRHKRNLPTTHARGKARRKRSDKISRPRDRFLGAAARNKNSLSRTRSFFTSFTIFVRDAPLFVDISKTIRTLPKTVLNHNGYSYPILIVPDAVAALDFWFEAVLISVGDTTNITTYITVVITDQSIIFIRTTRIEYTISI